MVEIDAFGGVTVPDCDLKQKITVYNDNKFDIDLGDIVENNVVDYEEYEVNEGRSVTITYRDRVWWRQPVSAMESVVREIAYDLSIHGDMDVMNATELAEDSVNSNIDPVTSQGHNADLGLEVRLSNPNEADRLVDEWDDMSSYERNHFNMVRRVAHTDVVMFRTLHPTNLEELEELYSTLRNNYEISGMVLLCQVPEE